MKIRVEQRDLDCFGVKIIRPSDPEFSKWRVSVRRRSV